MLVPFFGPTMNVIAYSPFQDAGSAKAVGGSDKVIASDAAHRPTRPLRRPGAIGFSSGSATTLACDHLPPSKAHGVSRCKPRGITAPFAVPKCHRPARRLQLTVHALRRHHRIDQEVHHRVVDAGSAVEHHGVLRA